MKIIGILGAMGPDSSKLLHQHMIYEFQRRFITQYNQVNPEVLIHNLFEPDPIAVMNDPNILLPSLITGVKQLAAAGVNFITVPCNTAHLYIQEMRQSIDVPIISMIEQVLAEIKVKNIQTVGLFATGLTVHGKVYHRIFEQNNIKIITPTDQAAIDKVITNLIAGKRNAPDLQVLLNSIIEMKNQAITTIIIGCTDLSIIFNQIDAPHLGIELIDTIQTYAIGSLKYYLKP